MPTPLALVALCRDEIAPRFDLTAEALLISLQPEEDSTATRKHLVLAHISSAELCDVATKAGVTVVVCGGIEEDYYHYLRWKRIDVISDVMGPLEIVLAQLMQGNLQSGDCLYPKMQETALVAPPARATRRRGGN